MTDLNALGNSQTDSTKETHDNEEETSFDDFLKTNDNEQNEIDPQLPFEKLDLIRALYC